MGEKLKHILMGKKGGGSRATVQLVLVMIVLAAIVYVFVNAPVRDGLGMMWLIPASFLKEMKIRNRKRLEHRK